MNEDIIQGTPDEVTETRATSQDTGISEGGEDLSAPYGEKEGEDAPYIESFPNDESEDTACEPEEDRSEYYAELLEEDLAEIKREFPELPENLSITDIKDPLRFGALRDLGLTPTEAYLAVGGRAHVRDNRAHLTATVPRTAQSRTADIPRSELKIARTVFSDMSEAELEKLYRRVLS